jgi:RimJ/RimL family protein N-acetyltransferase
VNKDVLRTDRLELRPTGPDMFEEIWRAVQTSADELAVWMPWAIKLDPEATRDFLERAAQSWESGHDRAFTIFKEGSACGQCSLDHRDPWATSAEIGYWMRSDLCGRGLMTEAASAVITFGFRTEGLHRIELHAGVGNAASIRVAEKLGFKKEGVLRHGGRGSNGYYDCYVYGLLDTDPRPNQSKAAER